MSAVDTKIGPFRGYAGIKESAIKHANSFGSIFQIFWGRFIYYEGAQERGSMYSGVGFRRFNELLHSFDAAWRDKQERGS